MLRCALLLSRERTKTVQAKKSPKSGFLADEIFMIASSPGIFFCLFDFYKNSDRDASHLSDFLADCKLCGIIVLRMSED